MCGLWSRPQAKATDSPSRLSMLSARSTKPVSYEEISSLEISSPENECVNASLVWPIWETVVNSILELIIFNLLGQNLTRQGPSNNKQLGWPEFDTITTD